MGQKSGWLKTANRNFNFTKEDVTGVKRLMELGQEGGWSVQSESYAREYLARNDISVYFISGDLYAIVLKNKGTDQVVEFRGLDNIKPSLSVEQLEELCNPPEREDTDFSDLMML